MTLLEAIEAVAGTTPDAGAGQPARRDRPLRNGGPMRHALPRHPEPAATSVTGTPDLTSRTARYHCPATDTSTSANPGLLPTRHPQTTRVSVHVVQACDNLLYGFFKGAPPARRAKRSAARRSSFEDAKCRRRLRETRRG